MACGEQLSIILASDISSVTQADMQAMLEWTSTLPVFQSLDTAEKMFLLKVRESQRFQEFRVRVLALAMGFSVVVVAVDS